MDEVRTKLMTTVHESISVPTAAAAAATATTAPMENNDKKRENVKIFYFNNI